MIVVCCFERANIIIVEWNLILELGQIKICILLVIFVNCRIGLDCLKIGHAVGHRLNDLIPQSVRYVVVRSVTGKVWSYEIVRWL